MTENHISHSTFDISHSTFRKSWDTLLQLQIFSYNSFNITEVITSETGVPRVKEEPVGLTVSLPERIPKQYVIPILARYYFRGGSHAQISFSAKNVDYSSTSLNGIPMRIVYIFHKYQFL